MIDYSCSCQISAAFFSMLQKITKEVFVAGLLCRGLNKDRYNLSPVQYHIYKIVHQG